MNAFLPLLKVSAMCAALMDKNVLVQRGALDVVSILFPFHQSFLLLPDLTSILSAALHTLLKRDVSLSRRLYVWLLGSQVHKSSLVNHVKLPSNSGDSAASDGECNHSAPSPDADNVSYFEKYSKLYLILALKGIMGHAKEANRFSLSKMECVLPYRLLRALLDQPEIGIAVTESIMPDLVSCLKEQIEGLGGIHVSHSHSSKEGSLSKIKGGDGNAKKSGKKGSLKADVIQSANLLFSTLSQDFVWCWVATMLEKCSADKRAPLAGSDEGMERLSGAGSSAPPPPEDAGHLTPITEFLKSSSDAKESSFGGRGSSVEEWDQSGGDRPLSLKALLAMLMFLMQVIPKVSEYAFFV